jgi:hypothetical protein
MSKARKEAVNAKLKSEFGLERAHANLEPNFLNSDSSEEMDTSNANLVPNKRMATGKLEDKDFGFENQFNRIETGLAKNVKSS